MILLKNKITTILFILSIFFISCGDTIEGRVAMKGNEPHTYLSIVTEKGQEFRIVGKLEKKISKNYQGNTIKIRGEIVKNGVGAGFPPHIDVNKIIHIVK